MIKKVIKGKLNDIVQQTITDQDDIEITDFPIGGITNEQMQQALTEDYAGFYQIGSVYLCTDNGDYGTKTHLYKFNGTSWEDVTPAGEEIDLSDYVKKTNDEEVDITAPLFGIVAEQQIFTSQGEQGFTQLAIVNDDTSNGLQIVSGDTNDNMAGLLVSATQDSVGVKVLKNGAFVDVATTDEIPDTSSMVTTNTAQDITGVKTIKNGLVLESTASSFRNSQGITMESGDDYQASMSINTNGVVGLCTDSDIYLQPSYTNNTKNGVVLSATKMYPLRDNVMSLGDTTHKYTDLHSTDAHFTNRPTVSGTNVALSSDLTNLVSQTDLDEVYENINRIDSYIPSETSTTNQLADKDFVNSSVSTNTANFKGTFTSTAQLPTTDVTNNDYAFVQETDSAGNAQYKRYKYNAGDTEWVYEYTLNNSSFTASQWATINSGVTSSTISNLNTAIGEIDEELGTIHTSLQNLSDSKQPKGDYALKSEIPDVSGFIKTYNNTSQTISSESTVPLKIKSTSIGGDIDVFINFFRGNDDYLGGLGINASKKPVFKDGLVLRELALKSDLSGYATSAQLLSLSTNTTTALSKKIGVPNYTTFTELSASTGFTYTPTTNGYIQARHLAGISNGTYFMIYKGTSTSGTPLCGYKAQAYNEAPTMIIPVKANETYYLQCNHVNDYRFYFIGEVS